MARLTEKPHGIMFHHLYNEKHCKGQGAISADQFEDIIRCYGSNILSSKEWLDKAMSNSLESNNVCLTFDDSLLCQYEIALPVLKKYRITAFWFVYSSVIDGRIEMLEVYRKFRTIYFADIDDFYRAFFLSIRNSDYQEKVELSLRYYSHDHWKQCPFYSENDTKFRYIRDVALGAEKYNNIMDKLMQSYQIDLVEFVSGLWMNKEHIKELDVGGHVIGLHSHTHPTDIAKLAVSEQKKEYQQNYDFLHGLLGKKPLTVSHPCNSYNEEILGILDNLGIKLGFRANMADHHYSKLEFPREDHINVINRVGK